MTAKKNDRPPPTDPTLVRKIASLRPIAKCLEKALKEVMEEDTLLTSKSRDINSNFSYGAKSSLSHDETIRKSEKRKTIQRDDFGPTSNSGQKIILDNKKIKMLMTTYADASETTSWDVKNVENIKGNANCTLPPAGILKGKLSHYNKFGSKWRLIIQNAVIQEKSTSDICGEPFASTGRRDNMKLNGDLILLAYDDK